MEHPPHEPQPRLLEVVVILLCVLVSASLLLGGFWLGDRLGKIDERIGSLRSQVVEMEARQAAERSASESRLAEAARKAENAADAGAARTAGEIESHCGR